MYYYIKYQIIIFYREFLALILIMPPGIVINGYVLYEITDYTSPLIFSLLPIGICSIYDIILLNQWQWIKNEYEFMNIHPTKWNVILIIKNLITILHLYFILFICWLIFYLMNIIDKDHFFQSVSLLWIIPLIMTIGNIASAIKKENIRKLSLLWISSLFLTKIVLISIHFVFFKGLVMPLVALCITPIIWLFFSHLCANHRSKSILKELL